jgi:hypothetical protein
VVLPVLMCTLPMVAWSADNDNRPMPICVAMPPAAYLIDILRHGFPISAKTDNDIRGEAAVARALWKQV